MNEMIQTYQNLVDQYLKSLFEDRELKELYEPMAYPVEAGGKRIRPVLCMLSCEAVGGKAETALPAAGALELLHTFTLVHDDIMDHDDMRRGHPTVHKKWDEATAILAGDGLVTLAYHSLLQTRHDDLVSVLKLFTEGLLVLCEGQAMDKAFESMDHVSMEAYETMIDKKTGELIQVSCEMGARLGGGSAEQVEHLRLFGRKLGRAFQIQDDLLDVISETSVTGKPMGSDLKAKKKTRLVIDFLNHAPADQIRAFRSFWEKPDLSNAEIEAIRDLFDSSGILNATRNNFFHLIEQALTHLSAIPESGARESLAAYAIKIRDRLS